MKITEQYLAGFFDGEGALLMRSRSDRDGRPAHVQIEAHITNNNIDLLHAIQREYGGRLSNHQNKHRMCHRLRWTNKSAILNLLKKISSHLILKRENAELMLQYIEMRPPHKRGRLSEDIFSFPQKMSELNSRLRHR